MHFINIARAALHEFVKRYNRSSEWPRIEREHLKLQPRCAACARSTRLQVHHIKPFYIYHELELDLSNLITLCMGLFEYHFDPRWHCLLYKGEAHDK